MLIGEFNGNLFEMFAILNEEIVVGTISVYQRFETMCSCGLEIFADYRRKGFGKKAIIQVIIITI